MLVDEDEHCDWEAVRDEVALCHEIDQNYYFNHMDRGLTNENLST